MNKTSSISSIDFAPTSNKEKIAPKLVTNISFRKQRERDPMVYTHMNQMAKNIALENSKDEREKVVQERKKNRQKYRQDLQAQLTLCNKEIKNTKKYEIIW